QREEVMADLAFYLSGPLRLPGAVEREDLPRAVSGHEQLIVLRADDGERALDHPVQRHPPGGGAVGAHEGDGDQARSGAVLGAHAQVHALLSSGEGGSVQLAGELWTPAVQR